MHTIALLLVFCVFAVLVLFQMRSAVGAHLGTRLGLLMMVPIGGVWAGLEYSVQQEAEPAEDQTASVPLSAQSCFKCHESHYTSWHQTYHRTMTREATPEYVKGDFNDAVNQYEGITTRMIRRGDKFFIETIDPVWAAQAGEQGISAEQAASAPRKEFSVDRLVGSHWFQQLMHDAGDGRYVRLPMVYHIAEKQWVHINGVFLGTSPPFFGRSYIWNETCLYCHNTRPSKNPLPRERGKELPGYNTEVGELGISCEACHGAGEGHVRAHQNPFRRLAQNYSGDADPTIVNPAKLSPVRSTDICARCHGAAMPRHREWNKNTFADPFLAGRDLKRFWHLTFSEREQYQQAVVHEAAFNRPQVPTPHDGRFWGDGTPLTTAVEYQGMALSPCYENGKGKMSCLTCHSMHHSDPNHQVKAGMRTNEACYQCHEAFRTKLVEHTHHPKDSHGSNCLNCHMPHQVYSLLDSHRSHRISIPRIKDSVGTGKPHACNLCHLDKSLGWTQEQLGKWFGSTPVALSVYEQTLASSLLHLAQSDGRSRALVAAVFSWPPAQEASGRDWPALLLTRTLEHERMEAVRYSAYKALRSLYGPLAKDYHYQGSAEQRALQLKILRRELESKIHPDPKLYPYLPLTSIKAPGHPSSQAFDEVFGRLLESRKDPDVYINE